MALKTVKRESWGQKTHREARQSEPPGSHRYESRRSRMLATVPRCASGMLATA